jgi:ribosomal protein S27AE
MSEEQSQSESHIVRRTWIIAFMIIEFLWFIPVLGIFGLLSNKRFGKDFWPAAAIIWVAFYFLTALRLRFLRCPRCGKSSFGNFLALFGGYVSPGQRYSLFSKECANCGFREDST